MKNILILVPLLFSGKMTLMPEHAGRLVLAFLSFSLMSSAVYIINDIKDREKDAKHPRKCHRPLASGAVGLAAACVLLALLIVVATILSVCLSLLSTWMVILVLFLYFVLNLGYSIHLKHVPVIEVAILASGFLIRVLYGGYATDIEVSAWLYLTVLSASFYMGLGKRRNEFEQHSDNDTRRVLKQYSRRFLDRNMYMFLSLTICFYSLWAMEHGSWALASVPVVMIACMRYSLIVEEGGDGDPTEVILSDKLLLVISAGYVIYMITSLYLV